MTEPETPNEAADAPVRPAATIVVVRSVPELEVYLLKRHQKSAFMPAFHVFPGGRVDPGDREAAAALESAVRAEAADRLDAVDDPLDAAAYAVAAVRETAEECGLLLARDAAGAPAGADAAEAVFEALRDGACFAAELGRRGLWADVGALRPFGWWITPTFQKIRFDTRFFIAEAPAGQTARIDEREVTEGRWMTPADALAAFAADDLVMAPPTLAALELLAAERSVDAALEALGRPIRPILPEMVEEDGRRVLALPGDALFPDAAEAALPHRTRFDVVGPMRFK